MGKKVLNLRILLTVILGILLFLSACGAASNETSNETMSASEPMTSTLPAVESEKRAAQSSDSVTTLPPETVPDQTAEAEEEEIFFDKSSRFTVSGLAGGITYREEGDRLITPGAVLVLDGRSFVLDSASGRLLFLGSSLEGVLHEQKVSDPGQAPSYMVFRNEEIVVLAGETLAVTHIQTYDFYEIALPEEVQAIGPLKLLRIGEQIVLCPKNDPGCREGYVLKEDGSFAPEKDLLVMEEDLEAELLHVTVGGETWELPMRVVKLPRSAEKYRREEQYDFLSWLPGIGLFMLKTDLKEGTQTVCFFRNDEEAQYFPVPEEPDPLNPPLPVPDRFTVADNGRIYFLRCGEYSADLYSSRRGRAWKEAMCEKYLVKFLLDPSETLAQPELTAEQKAAAERLYSMSNEEMQKFLEKYQIASQDQDRETFLNKVMKELRKVIDSGEYFDTENYRAMSGMADWGMTLADLRVAIREELGLPYQTTIWMYNGAAYSWSPEAETAPMPVP